MPTYEYRCSNCAHEMEAVQRISADALTTCPECSDETLKRLISQSSFMLKGGGWYGTDYAGKKTHDKVTSEPSGSRSSDDPSKSTGSDSSKSTGSDSSKSTGSDSSKSTGSDSSKSTSSD
jgi:putative FmdB family regulatory protein